MLDVKLSNDKKLKYDPKNYNGILVVNETSTFLLRRDELKELATFLNNRGEFQNRSKLKDTLHDHLSNLENTSRMFNDIHNALEIIGFDKLAKRIMDIDKSLNMDIASFCEELIRYGLD